MLKRGMISIAALFVALPALAGQSDEERLRELIKQAEQARAEAQTALERADAALAAAQRALANRAPMPGPIPAATPPNECDDAFGEAAAAGKPERLSTANWMLKPGDRETNNADEKVDGLNKYAKTCLGLTKASQYKNTTDLSLQLAGTKGDGVLDAVISRTIRRFSEVAPDGILSDDDRFRSSYTKYLVGGFGAAGTAGDASLFNLTDFEFSTGIGFQFGVEWGRSAAKSRKERREAIYDGIAKARRECVAYHGVLDPMNAGDQTRDVVRNPDAIGKCEGAALVKWMEAESRNSGYWSEIVAPLWGHKAESEIFAGWLFRYGYSDIKYRPIKDPATGNVIATTLPGEIELHTEPFSMKGYAGFMRPFKMGERGGGKVGGTFSLTWRREYSFVDKTKDQQVCFPDSAGAGFDLCKSMNLAAPYELEGLVAGGSLNLQIPRFWYLPQFAASLRPSYAFDTDRWGLEMPLFLLTDADGKLNSGLKFNCRFKGRTRQGLELPEECGIGIFVGTNFDLTK
ncbi:hypothetical protein [Sphingomonas sp.]|uniref:hypothetical protein n=1 Tax=Sphingomonas sp. TaxID=28214 RepID=UPI0031E13B66